MKYFIALIVFISNQVFAADFLEQEISFTEMQIHDLLLKQGPLEKNYKGLVSVVFQDVPQISLGNPMGKATIFAKANLIPLGQRAIPVEIVATSGVRYDDSAKSFFLEDPVVNSVSSPALPPEYETPASHGVSKFLANYFRTKPVYVLRDDRSMKESAARWLMKSVRIEQGKVVATLSPF